MCTGLVQTHCQQAASNARIEAADLSLWRHGCWQSHVTPHLGVALAACLKQTKGTQPLWHQGLAQW